MRQRSLPRAGVFGALALVLLAGCVLQQRRLRSNALEYLYPKGSSALPAPEVRLQVPVRVGVAFAPSTSPMGDSFTSTQKEQLLERVAAAFRGRKEIADVQGIPTSHLTAGGGFEELDRIRAAFGVDLVALISYDQFQFSESSNLSWTYWTLVGAYVVKGEKNETRTLLDAAIFDVPSRALLFHASGQSRSTGSATPIHLQRDLRKRSEQGFDEAMNDLILKLDTALAAFSEQAATGTVRGPGTPAIAMVDSGGQPIPAGGGGGGGGGAFGPGELLALALLAGAGLLFRRR